MEERVEIKEEFKENSTIAQETNEQSVNYSAHKEESGYFKYYLYILFNSVIGFILALYFSKKLLGVLAEKNILDLSHMNMIPSVVVATTLTMIFMILTIAFKKFFRMFFFSEIILYIYVGVLTTLINIISWNFFFKLIGSFIVSESVAWKVAEVIAFIVAVVFAFFADKIFVFKSYNFMPGKLFAEMGIFFSARIITELINIGIMYFIIDYKKQEPLFGKIAASVVIIILNYLFSKFIIFKKKKNEEQAQ